MKNSTLIQSNRNGNYDQLKYYDFTQRVRCIIAALHLNIFQSRTFFFLFQTCFGLNMCACAVDDSECACVENSVADVAVEIIEERLAILAPVLYH